MHVSSRIIALHVSFVRSKRGDAQRTERWPSSGPILFADNRPPWSALCSSSYKRRFALLARRAPRAATLALCVRVVGGVLIVDELAALLRLSWRDDSRVSAGPSRRATGAVACLSESDFQL